MVDTTKIAKRTRKPPLPEPPTEAEASDNIQAPENAPAPVLSQPQPQPLPRLDGRSLRATGRVESFSTRVRLEFKNRLIAAAHRDGITMAEVLEKALELYEREGKRKE